MQTLKLGARSPIERTACPRGGARGRSVVAATARAAATACVALALALPATALAATVFWTGSSPLGREWSRFLNWEGAPPSSDGSDNVYFGDTDGHHNPLQDAAVWAVNGVVIQDDVTYLFSGEPLLIGAGGLRNLAPVSGSGANHGFLNDIELTSEQHWVNLSDGGLLTVTGDVRLQHHNLYLEPDPDASISVRGNVTGSGTLYCTGPGVATLSGANGYSGGTYVLSGTLRAAADNVIPAGTVILGQGTLDLTGHQDVLGPGNSPDIGVYFLNQGGGRILSPTHPLVISTLGIWIGYNGTQFGSTITAGELPLATSGGTREILVADGAADHDLTLEAAITGGGQPGSTPSILKRLPGTLALDGSNSFTRPLRIEEGRVVALTSGALGAAGPGNETVLAATLLLQGDLTIADEVLMVPNESAGRLVAHGGAVWAGPMLLERASALVLDAQDAGSLTVTGTIEGDSAQGVTKTGAGPVALISANSYGGGTIVNEGMLRAASPSGSPTGAGSVMVEGGATLDAGGHLDGPVTVQKDGVLQIDGETATGILDLPACTFLNGSTYSATVGAETPEAACDRLDVAGQAGLAGTLRVHALSMPAEGDSFMVMTFVSRNGGFQNLELPELSPPLVWDVGYRPNSLVLTVRAASAAPEAPSPADLLFEAVPNPAVSAVELRFGLAHPAAVGLAIYDARGRRVAGILAGARLGPGPQAATWDLRDAGGRPVASGIYFARFELDGVPAPCTQRVAVAR